MQFRKYSWLFVMVLMMLGLSSGIRPGVVEGADIMLYATAGYITEPDGGQVYMWGFSDVDGSFRYPGPTLDVMQGDTVNVTLINSGVPEPVSILFFGQDQVTNQTPYFTTVGDNGTLRSMASEAAPNGGSVTYTFVAKAPGTYYYQSGTDPEKQIDMGLFGALIVRPAGYNAATNKTAYGTPDSKYDKEFFFIMSAVDAIQHKRVELGLPYQSTAYLPTYWFINGRSYPDTLKEDEVGDLPNQPMSAMVEINAGQNNLFRVMTLDRDIHPLHHHGENATIIAHNGRLLSTGSGIADLATSVNTESTHAGETFDGIYMWKNIDLGWDVYGHKSGDGHSADPLEWGTDHDLPLPVNLPQDINMIFGDDYGGSPFIGKTAPLPVGHVQLNMDGANIMMMHSHHETEIQNFDLGGPGGLMTHIMIMP